MSDHDGRGTGRPRCRAIGIIDVIGNGPRLGRQIHRFVEVRDQKETGINKCRYGESGRDFFRKSAQALAVMARCLCLKNDGLRSFHPPRLVELH